MFGVIRRLANEGINEITEIEVENVVRNYPIEMEVFQDNNYMDFIYTAKQLCVLENYEYYYTTIRKFSLLRELKEQGFSIKDFYDELEDEERQNAKFEKITIQDILNKIEFKEAQLRTKYDVKYVRDELVAGEDTQELINSFKEQPAFGAYLQSGYLSTIYNGWSRGHLMLRAGASGVGKSATSIADLCCVGVLEMWDDIEQDFISNDNYQTPTLYIATEQELRSEIEPKFLSCVSGVEYSRITKGLITKEEERRVLKAGKILKESGLTLCSMPNFTSKSLERKIKEQVELNGIGYMAFDYMEVQADLSGEFKANSAVVPRQDLVLLSLTSDLKRYCEDYNVGILSGMQLNDSWKEARFVDESCLSGSRAVKNKVDYGSIIVPTSYLKKDMKLLDSFFKRRGFGSDREKRPNICEFIFKSRYSIYGDRRLKIWTYFDRGTFRRHDYLITNDDNEVQYDIKPTEQEERDSIEEE